MSDTARLSRRRGGSWLDYGRYLCSAFRDVWNTLQEMGRNTPEVDAWFDKNLAVEYKGYNAKLVDALNQNLLRETDRTVSVGGIQSALFTTAQAQAGAKTIFLNQNGNLEPLSNLSLKEQINAFKDAYTSGMQKRVSRIANIKAMQAKQYASSNAIEKKQAKILFQNFPDVSKEFTTDFFVSKNKLKESRTLASDSSKRIRLDVSFSGGMVGSLRGFFSFKFKNVLPDFRDIFENAQYAYSTNYIIKEQRWNNSFHKEHDNYEGYHHFINKVEFDNKPYYVHFIVEELKR